MFFCPELIVKLGGARNVKFGTQVNNNESTIKFEDLCEIFTPHRDEIRFFYNANTLESNSSDFYAYNKDYLCLKFIGLCEN